MSEWISVKDRLPEKSGEYLVCTVYREWYAPMNVMSFSTRYGKFNAGDRDDGDRYAVDGITHWMPLPKPPRKERR